MWNWRVYTCVLWTSHSRLHDERHTIQMAMLPRKLPLYVLVCAVAMLPTANAQKKTRSPAGQKATAATAESRPSAPENTPAYRNPNLAIEDRVADLLSRMTLEEKVEQ